MLARRRWSRAWRSDTRKTGRRLPRDPSTCSVETDRSDFASSRTVLRSHRPTQFVRLRPPDWCRHFDPALGRDLSDVVYQFDAPSACRTGACKTVSVSKSGRGRRNRLQRSVFGVGRCVKFGPKMWGETNKEPHLSCFRGENRAIGQLWRVAAVYSLPIWVAAFDAATQELDAV